jgi:hypothetical protein
MIDKIAAEFVKDLRWLNPENPSPAIILYGMRKKSVPAPVLNKSSYINTVTRMYYTQLFDEEDDWGGYIDVFDINLNKHLQNLQFYEEILSYFLTTLITQGAVLSWFMFDGGFMNIRRPFLEAYFTYAFYIPGQEPVICLKREDRSDKIWMEKFRLLKIYYQSQFEK